jgi:hypothetical protein
MYTLGMLEKVFDDIVSRPTKNSFVRMSNGKFGVRVFTAENKTTGDEVLVAKKDGSTSIVVLEDLVEARTSGYRIYSFRNPTSQEAKTHNSNFNLKNVDFPGEDRSFGGNSLFVDLIPETSWFSNVRSEIPKEIWDKIRRSVYSRANYTCEVCGRTPERKPGDWIECHERWEYINDSKSSTGRQILKRFIALCTACHETTHIGLANLNGRGDMAMEHLQNVTGMSESEASMHIDQAFTTWRKRSKKEWKLEMPLLGNIAPEFVLVTPHTFDNKSRLNLV